MAADQATWDHARQLVVDDRLSYAEVAERTGIPLSTLQKRAGAEQWRSQRQDGLDYIEGLKALKRRELKKLLAAPETADISQQIHALRGLEAVCPEHRYGEKAGITYAQRLEVAADVMRVVTDYLADNDPWLLGKLKAHLDPITNALEQAAADAG